MKSQMKSQMKSHHAMQDEEDAKLLERADEAVALRRQIEMWTEEADRANISPERRRDLRASIREAERRWKMLLGITNAGRKSR